MGTPGAGGAQTGGSAEAVPANPKHNNAANKNAKIFFMVFPSFS
jgi:hypothetical protein